MSNRTKWGERLKFILFFLVVTVAVHSLLGWFQAWLPRDPYRAPTGAAVKVFQSGESKNADDPGDRLRLFYWYGE